jgi:drug/metabolite transporter (DMT)-like permease
MKEYKAALLLVLASVIWGFTFAFQSQAADLIQPFSYNGIRMLIGAVVLSPLALKGIKKRKADPEYRRNLTYGGLLCGVLIAAASVFQQYGIGLTSAGRAGFITSIYALLVPVFSIAIGKKVSPGLWVCVFAGLLGLFLLSTGAESGKIGTGEIMLIICAVLFTFQIMSVDHFAPFVEGPDISFIQFLVGGLISLVFGFIFETISWQIVKAAMIPILYAGIFSCGVAYTLQIVGQKYVQPTKATLILCLESFWAAVGGALILGETMTGREITGCVITLGAVMASQLMRKD